MEAQRVTQYQARVLQVRGENMFIPVGVVASADGKPPYASAFARGTYELELPGAAAVASLVLDEELLTAETIHDLEVPEKYGEDFVLSRSIRLESVDGTRGIAASAFGRCVRDHPFFEGKTVTARIREI